MLGFFLSGRLGDFMLPLSNHRAGLYARSFLPITLAWQGRICKKYTSKRRNQARQPIFAPIKTGAVTDGKARRERIRRPESGRKGRLEAKKENLYIYIWIIVVIFAYK